MSEPRLNDLRRNELIRILKEMMADNIPSNIETWVPKVFLAATQPPAAVIHAAEVLGRWNCYGNSPSSHHGNVKFLPPEEGYETIAEVVLTAAHEFDKANEEESTRPQTLVHVPMNFDNLINRVEEALRFINNTIGSSTAGSEQVVSLGVVVDMLIKLKDNYLLVPKNE